MLFELLKTVSEVELIDKNTKEKKLVNVTEFYLRSDELDKNIRIEPHKIKNKDGFTISNKDILSILATDIDK